MVTDLIPNNSKRLLMMNTPLKRPRISNPDSVMDKQQQKRPKCPSPGSEEATPVKRFKENDLFYVGSPREIRRLRSDLVDARNKIENFENRIASLHTARKSIEIMYDKEVNELKTQRDKDKKSIEELESQLQSIRKREQTLKKELFDCNMNYKILKNNTDMQIQKLDSSISTLKTEMQYSTSDENNEVTALKRKISELEYIYKAAQEETEAHKSLVVELNKRVADRSNIEGQLEIKTQALAKAHLQIKDISFSKASYLEYQQQSKTQQHKLIAFSDLEKENIKLREEVKNLKDEVHNKLVLEEEVHSLKTRLQNFKGIDTKYTNLQVINAQTELYLEEFRVLARSICETSSDSSLPRLLRGVLENLQQQEINLTSEKIQLESQLSQVNHVAKVAKDELDKSQKHIADLQKNVKQHQNLIHRMQKKLSLVAGERDSYRKQLDSYEKDLTICINPASLANPGGVQIQSQQERIKNLEKMVDGYRDMVHKLETDLQNVEPNIEMEITPIKAQQISRLQDEIEKLNNENAMLRERKDVLEIQLEEYLVGHDETKARIIHNEKNPLSEIVKLRGQENEKLEEEVDRLKRKIKNLEEGLEASRLADETTDNKDILEVKEQLRSSEQHLQRLKEYFKSSMQEFRNVSYMLLGYKIDKTSSSQYKLTSMYAERPDDFLSFRLNNDGAMNLLANEFSSNLHEMIDLHLHHQRSIPVFLSSLTMDLFNNRTITKTFEVEDESDDD